MSDQRRQPSGTPKGGQFAAGARTETGTELTPAPAGLFISTSTGRPVQLTMSPGLEGRNAGLPAERPADWEPFGNALDRTVDSVHQGKLSRGVASGDQARNLRVWHMWANEQAAKHRIDDPDTAAAYEQFTAGLEHGVIALMSDKAEVRDDYVISLVTWQLGSPPRPGDYAQARRLLTQKRTSAASRAEWAGQLQHAPSEAAHRGSVTAALVLSGLDDWWGLRDDPHAVVTGPGGEDR